MPVLYSRCCMLTVVGTEYMRTRKIRIGTHIQIIRCRCIEHHIQCLRGSTTDWTGRQPRIFVGVIRRINGKMALQHTAQRKISIGIDYRRTRLQQHTLVYTVQIQTCHNRQFLLVVRFPFYYTCYYRYLHRRQP